MRMAEEYKGKTFIEYAKFVIQEGEYPTETKENWEIADKEWKMLSTHEELIAKIKPIKDAYVLRNKIKWGSNYTFEELISLENLFVNTLSANNVTNPMQIDAIKKACKMSVALDRVILTGESKSINELSKAYQNFIKTAKIDEIITAASEDVVSTVADLVNYIEEQGYQFKYYDGVSRDIVDASLKDQQEFLRRLVLDNTSLDSIFETIEAGLRTQQGLEKDAESYEVMPLEDLYSGTLEAHNQEFDKELESDRIEDLDEEDEEWF